MRTVFHYAGSNQFLRNNSGSTAIEYALIAAGVALAIVSAVNALGGVLGGIFNDLAAKTK